MVTKKLVFAAALLFSLPAFGGPPADSGRDPLADLLISIEQDALTALKGISLKRPDTECGKLIEGKKGMLDHLEVHWAFNASHTREGRRNEDYLPLEANGYLVEMVGSQRFVGKTRRVDIIVELGRLAQRRVGEPKDHQYAGLIAAFILSKNGDPNYEVAQCVIDFLKERDLTNRALSSGSSQPDAGTAR